jgi:hypothetical protein
MLFREDINGSRFPFRIEISGLMEVSAPDAFPADMLDQRGRVVEDGLAPVARQPRDAKVAEAFDLVPAADDIAQSGFGEQERLAAVHRIGRHQPSIAGQMVARFAQLRVVKAGQRKPAFPHRWPVFEIMH